MPFTNINDNNSGTLYLLCDDCGDIVYLATSKQGIRVEERGMFKIVCEKCSDMKSKRAEQPL